MKRFLTVLLVLGLVASALVAPASAGKRKAKPIATTFYFHGQSPVGEPDGLDGALAGAVTGTGYAKMDATEPTGAPPKSMTIVSYVGGPNTTCGGSYLSPAWIGDMVGTVVGDVKVTFDAISTPTGQVDVQLYPDQTAFACEISPAAEVRVDLPAGPGQVEAVIEDVKVPVLASLMVQITPVTDTPYYSRVLYDSPDYPSKVEFGCIPAAGAKSCA
jgi:hypothetical protein